MSSRRIYQLPSGGGMTASGRLARSADALHLRFDPGLDFAIERIRAAADTGRRRADAHRNDARILEEAVARPDTAGVVRNRDHRNAGAAGKPRAAGLKPAPRAVRDAGTLRKDHDPEAALEPVDALLAEASQRLRAR